MAVINELITELGFNLKDGTTRKIDEFESKINGLTESFEKIGKTVTGGLGIKDFFMNALSGSQDLMNMSKAYRISTEALQEWKYAAEVSGVSAENLMTDLYHLRKNFFMNEKAVLNLADRFKSMNEAQALWEGQDLYGLSIDTILTLRRGAKELREEFNRAPKTPKEVLQNAEKLNRELIRQKANMKKIAETIALEVTPKFNNWMEKFNNWMGESPGRTEMLVQGVTGALALLTGSSIVSGISNFASALTPLLKAIGGLKGLLIGGALAAAIYGLYDSFQAFKRGEETFIPWEKILEGADEAKRKINDVKNAWENFRKRMKEKDEEIGKDIEKEIEDSLVGSITNEFPNALQQTLNNLIIEPASYVWKGVQSIAGKTLLDLDQRLTGMKEEDYQYALASMKSAIWGNSLKKPDISVPPNWMGMENLPNQSISKEVDITGKSIKSLADTIHENMVLKKDAFGNINNANGAPNFAGSMITVFTADTMEDAVRYLQENGALMSDVEDMSVYQTNMVE